MVEYTDLDGEEKLNILYLGNNWYDKNKKHVDELRKNSQNSIYPSGSDMWKPELWKGSHWNWFFELEGK